MAKGCLGFEASGVDQLFTKGALEATRQFIREARGFDPNICEQDLFQALRNLWVIHSLQCLLDTPVALSPAAFGYSMLYPWTDNYLDDARIDDGAKVRFCRWLEDRLAENNVEPDSERAEQVERLIGLIERCYPRESYPEVFLSLRAIHQGQMESLRQLRPHEIADPQELLRITIAKGGTSVLTDGYLIRGRLDAQEADFVFGYGVLLQLMDDLQDLQDDLAMGRTTLFSKQAVEGPMDQIVSNLWAFGVELLQSPRCFAEARSQRLKGLILENCKLMVLQAVAQNPAFYTQEFLSMLEAHSVFHFAFFRERAKSVARERARILRTLRRTRQIGSLFDLLE